MIFALWYIDIPNRVAAIKVDIQLLLLVVKKIVYPFPQHDKLYLKKGSLTLTNAGTLICFITPPFSYSKVTVGSEVEVVLLKMEHFVWNHKKNARRERNIFLNVAAWMKLYSLNANIEWKHSQKGVMTWCSKTRKGPSCHITFWKWSVARKYFWFAKLQGLNGLKPKTYIFETFWDRQLHWSPSPPKRRDFATKVGYVIIFPHIFLTNVLIAGKPS